MFRDANISLQKLKKLASLAISSYTVLLNVQAASALLHLELQLRGFSSVHAFAGFKGLTDVILYDTFLAKSPKCLDVTIKTNFSCSDKKQSIGKLNAQ